MSKKKFGEYGLTMISVKKNTRDRVKLLMKLSGLSTYDEVINNLLDGMVKTNNLKETTNLILKP